MCAHQCCPVLMSIIFPSHFPLAASILFTLLYTLNMIANLTDSNVTINKNTTVFTPDAHAQEVYSLWIWRQHFVAFSIPCTFHFVQICKCLLASSYLLRIQLFTYISYCTSRLSAIRGTAILQLLKTIPIVTSSTGWRRQVWGTGARTPLTSDNTSPSSLRRYHLETCEISKQAFYHA